MASGSDIVIDLGREDYNTVLLLQRHLNHLSNEGLIGNTLILVEHEDTYTVGIHRNSNEILSDNITPIVVERGGSATYHGPGQIVVYFVFNMKNMNTNIKEIITKVESSVTRVLEGYGINAEGRLHGETGVWVGNRKICSIGFAIRGFSTLHGIALNVSTDLEKFGAILPCGMDSTVMTSIEQEIGDKVDYPSVRKKLKEEIISNMKIENYLEIDSIDKMRGYSVSNGLGLLPEELL